MTTCNVLFKNANKVEGRDKLRDTPITIRMRAGMRWGKGKWEMKVKETKSDCYSTWEHSFKVALHPQGFIGNGCWNLLMITEVLTLGEQKDVWLAFRIMWSFDYVFAPLWLRRACTVSSGVAIVCKEEVFALHKSWRPGDEDNLSPWSYLHLCYLIDQDNWIVSSLNTFCDIS